MRIVPRCALWCDVYCFRCVLWFAVWCALFCYAFGAVFSCFLVFFCGVAGIDLLFFVAGSLFVACCILLVVLRCVVLLRVLRCGYCSTVFRGVVLFRVRCGMYRVLLSFVVWYCPVFCGVVYYFADFVVGCSVFTSF